MRDDGAQCSISHVRWMVYANYFACLPNLPDSGKRLPVSIRLLLVQPHAFARVVQQDKALIDKRAVGRVVSPAGDS
jgi:hypothetical protein